MSKKRWLIVPLCAVLCSQGLFAQTLDRRVLGIDEMFRLADENSQSIQTYKTGKEAADEALKAAKSQRLPDIGALKNDITRYELQKETLKLQLAKVQDTRKIMNHQLVTTLHLPAGTEIVPDSTLLNEEVTALAENDWQMMASQSNVGLQQAQLAMKMNEQKVKLERSELLPKIALVAGEHLDGPITIEVPVLDNNFNYWYVGVGIKYNLSSLFKNNKKVRQAKLNVRRAQEEYSLAQEQIENGVQANYVNFLTSFTDLRTQEKSVELADQNYNVTSNRYKNDLALLTDMLDASNMKLSADLGLVNARINLIYSYYKMKYITHTL